MSLINTSIIYVQRPTASDIRHFTASINATEETYKCGTGTYTTTNPPTKQLLIRLQRLGIYTEGTSTLQTRTKESELHYIHKYKLKVLCNNLLNPFHPKLHTHALRINFRTFHRKFLYSMWQHILLAGRHKSFVNVWPVKFPSTNSVPVTCTAVPIQT
jgi:hypothetical protein